MNHTPTPWVVQNQVGNLQFCITGRDMFPVAQTDALMDAAHIVHCVNTYAGLVEALESCIDELRLYEQDENERFGSNEQEEGPALQYACKILALARKETFVPKEVPS